MKRYFSIILGITLLIYSSCKKSDNPTGPDDNSGSNKIEVGTSIDLVTQSVSSGGGTIKIDKSGDPLNGMEITLEPSSFTSTKNFKISYAEIKNHQLGQYFKPLSPLISINYEGGYSDIPMEVKVPIKLPAGHFAMAYFYDDKTGELEGLPVEKLDSISITVSTRTFSSASSLTKRNTPNDATSTGMMVISSISESVLKSQGIIASGFLPGVDDWEFVNYGSYIATGGHCAGQSMTMMWYYYEKKLKGELSLFHKFDEVNDKTKPGLLWQDNPYGYRFASTIQKDFNFDGWITSLQWKQLFPGLTFNSFAASILLTGEPQFVLIRNSAGQGGHAMVVYKVNMSEGKLYIADPNYPNNRIAATGVESIRTIDYVNGVLKPYETGLTAGAQSTTMDQIGYFGKTTYIDWGQMAKRWVEFENKTIGNDRFPKYNLKLQNDGDKELTDQMITDKDTLKVYCKSTDITQSISHTDHYTDFQVYDDKGNFLAIGEFSNKGIASIPIKSSQTKLGFYVMGYITPELEYVDFKWININKRKLKIEPDPLDGKPNEEQSWIAHTFGTGPKPYKMIWNFGDQSSEVTTNNDSTAKHTYTKDGAYTVRVKLYDQNNSLWAEAVATANIQGQLGNPEITSISPDSAIAEQTITIIGKNFGAEQKEGYVYIVYNIPTEVISWTNTQIVVKVPLKAKNYVFISVVRKTTGDQYQVWSNQYKYKIYPDVIVTLKRVDRSGWTFSGNLINQNNEIRSATVGKPFSPDKPTKFTGLTFTLTTSDSLDTTPGKEIFWNYNCHLTVTSDGQSISGTVGYTGENRYVGPPTIYKREEITISNMKLEYFDHETVRFSFTEAEAKSVVTSFLDDGGWGWDKYVNFETLTGYIYFYEKTW